MKKYLLLLLVAAPLSVWAGEDPTEEFDQHQAAIKKELDAFDNDVRDITSLANSTGNQSLRSAASGCEDSVNQCRSIYDTLSKHRANVVNNCTQMDIFNAQEYGSNLLCKNDLSEARTKVTAIKVTDLPWYFCCSRKHECKKDIEHYVVGITIFINKIEKDHKGTFNNMIAQQRLQQQLAVQRRTIASIQRRQLWK